MTKSKLKLLQSYMDDFQKLKCPKLYFRQQQFAGMTKVYLDYRFDINGDESVINFQGLCDKDDIQCTLIYVPKRGMKIPFTNEYKILETDFEKYAVIQVEVSIKFMDFNFHYKKLALLTREKEGSEQYLSKLRKYSDLPEK